MEDIVRTGLYDRSSAVCQSIGESDRVIVQEVDPASHRPTSARPLPARRSHGIRETGQSPHAMTFHTTITVHLRNPGPVSYYHRISYGCSTYDASRCLPTASVYHLPRPPAKISLCNSLTLVPNMSIAGSSSVSIVCISGSRLRSVSS